MNIANKLTLFRICMIPVFIGLLYWPTSMHSVEVLGASLPTNQLLAAIVFAVASFTDFLDGFLARKHNLVTVFGEFFDPMADKLLVLSAFILLVAMGKVPAWVAIIIISRELLVTGLRVLLAKYQGSVMAAALPGKIKTFSQMFAILFFLLEDAGFVLVSIPIATLLLYICLFFTVYSGIDYFYHARHIFGAAM